MTVKKIVSRLIDNNSKLTIKIIYEGGKMKPEDLKYTKNHIWAYVDGDTAVAGITDYAQQELGDIVFVELPEVGKEVKMDEAVGTIESVKSVSDIEAPLSGKITEVNKILEDAPETINKDPYGEGWIFKMTISNPDEINSLMDLESYNKFTESQR